MQGLRRSRDELQVTGGLGKLHLAKRGVQIVSKTATATTRNAAVVYRALQNDGGDTDDTATTTQLVTIATEPPVKAAAKATRGGLRVANKAVKRSLVAVAQKRTAAKKVAEGVGGSARAARASAAVARLAQAVAALVRTIVSAVVTLVASTPVTGIILAVISAILVVLSILSWLPGVASTVHHARGNGGTYRIGVEPGAWGDYKNGEIPLGLLTPIPWAADYRLRDDATAALEALNEKYVAQYGTNLVISDAYRDLAGQVKQKSDWCAKGKCQNAAEPGTSIHGWGLAVDLGGGINTFGSSQYQWMQQHAGEFGWKHPAWAEPNGSKPEPWHWEFWGWAGSSGGSGKPEGAVQAYAKERLKVVFLDVASDTDAQFACLQTLWNNESNWNPAAKNPSSGAYGIPQALPGDQMASAGSDWQTNPETQVNWGLQYIKERYVTPCQAWDFWQKQSPNWY